MKGKSPDPILIIVVLALVGLGLIMILSASSIQALNDHNDSYYFFKRQVIWVLVGIPLMLFFTFFNYRNLSIFAKPLLLLSIILLIVVLFPSIGTVSGGSRRWLVFGVFRFQPSEVAKIAVIIYLADFLVRKKDVISEKLSNILPPLFLLALIFYLIIKEPDLGTAAAILGTSLVMIFAGGAKIAHLGLIGLGSLPVLYYFIMGEEYRRQRMLAFLNPWSDPLDSGFHIIQSLYALGSGGLLGLGFGQSKQKFFYLPTPSTDFIFAVIGEELGLIGALVVVGLFFLLAWRGIAIALKATDLFGTLLATGITTMITLQAIINIAVVTGSIPITGISLPFLSYGGSSLTIMLVSAGILLNISKQH